MYKRILVPVDGSRLSEQILPHVGWLSRKTGANVALLRVIDKEEERPEAVASVERLAHDVPATPICAVNSGGVVQTILDEAARVAGTLVAMTSHGRSGLMRAILGSTAFDVLRTGQEPVLVFRPPDGDPPTAFSGAIERVVVPLDGSEHSESILPAAGEWARWLGARIVVASVLEPGAAAGFPAGDVVDSSYVRVRASQLAQRHGIDVGWEVLQGDPKQAIPAFVRSLPNTMLAMTTRGRRELQSVLVGSVAAATLQHVGVPVYMGLH
jgi:nucleotide-binding universal stress UspA family protein